MATSAQQTKSMGYDGLDRLTSTTSPMFGTASYVYDAIDNLKQVTVSGGPNARTHYYCYNAANQLEFVRSGSNCSSSPAVINLGYDVQGNLANKTGTAGGSYTFDYGNRLRTTAGLTYRYDADGRRVRQDTAGASLKYSYYAKDGRLVWQRDEPNSKRISNLYLAGSLVAEYTRPIGVTTPTVSYLHTDALGSPIAKTNSSGTVIETSEYEPYGKLLNRANDDRAGYTGHVMDSASGLTYMQQRYYDPLIGRFLSVDPVTALSNPVGQFNVYRYAANNPYRFIDPDGRVDDDPNHRSGGVPERRPCNSLCQEERRRITQERISQIKRESAKQRRGHGQSANKGSKVSLGIGGKLFAGAPQLGFIGGGGGGGASIGVRIPDGLNLKELQLFIEFNAHAAGGLGVYGGVGYGAAFERSDELMRPVETTSGILTDINVGWGRSGGVTMTAPGSIMNPSDWMNPITGLGTGILGKYGGGYGVAVTVGQYTSTSLTWTPFADED